MSLDVRGAAALIIGDVLAGQSLDRALPRQLEKVKERDRSLLRQLCYGTLRHEPRLQALLAQLLDKPLRDKDRDVQALLMCGLYQLDHTRIPDHAAVAATVGATKALKKPWAKKLSNAILRRYLRERESLTGALSTAAAASHPKWLHDKIQSQWPSAASDLLAANNEQPPMTLRINAQKTTRDAYVKALEAQGIECSEGRLSPFAIYLSEPVDVSTLPGFGEGLVSVQDEAAQLAAILLSAGAGERVLDACAAPGGKACHVLELAPELLELVAMDIEPTRLERVEENLQRLELQATVHMGDGAQPPDDLEPASFDRILLDAPCSASGVIRRHPDIKILRRESDIASLSKLQGDILRGVWSLLKPGGTLLYVTCSIFEEENSAVVRHFLQQEEGAEPVPLDAAWGEAVDCGRQLLPTTGGADGLFYTLLKKSP